MVAYSFQPQFIEPIRLGLKTHTLRGVGRRRHAREGDTVQIYSGMRTRSCKLHGTATCIGTLSLSLDFNERRVEFASGHAITTPDDTDAFAIKDGFPEGWRQMEAFWAKHHPGVRVWDDGLMIQWGQTFTPA